MNIRYEIEEPSAPGDKPALRWLFDRYHLDWQWRFVAGCEHIRYGYRSYETYRVWRPTEEGWVLFNHNQKEVAPCAIN